jgi:8-amino-7-oxononanoate synthase
MPPAQAVALSAALRVIRSDEAQRREILAARIRQVRWSVSCDDRLCR